MLENKWINNHIPPPPPRHLAGEIRKESLDVIQEKISTIQSVIPECFSENKIDFDKFKSLFGDAISTGDEKYALDWAGRNDTFRNIQVPTTGTLVPDRKESVNFDETENIFIEGENLEVLKLLQKSYFGRIKMIYIDPPYNTGKDFIYKDNFHIDGKSYLERTGQSENGIRLTSNPETSGRFHSDWLSFMYARLFVARNLLSDDGVIFVSIDDNEVHNLRIIMSEIFGEENYRNSVIIKRGTSNIQSQFSTVQKIKNGYESLLMYTKNSNYKLPKPVAKKTEKTGAWNNHWRSTNRPTLRYELFGKTPATGTWRWSKKRSFSAIENYKTMIKELTDQNLDVNSQNIDDWYIKKLEKLECDKLDLLRLSNNGKPEHFVPPNRSELLTDVWLDINSNGSRKLRSLLENIHFDNPKSIDLLKRCMIVAAHSNSIILDFFAGSGTTAHAVMELNKEDGGNRKFICVQIPEKNTREKCDEFPTIADICKERIRRAIRQVDTDGKNLGFKAFKLSKSNYKIWRDVGKESDRLKAQIKLFESPLIENYRNEDVIYECIIKEGYSLNSRIEKLSLKSNTTYKISDKNGSFYICLDKSINDKITEEAQINGNDVLICIDAALDDSQKTNLSKQCDLRTL